MLIEEMTMTEFEDGLKTCVPYIFPLARSKSMAAICRFRPTPSRLMRSVNVPRSEFHFLLRLRCITDRAVRLHTIREPFPSAQEP